MNKEITIIDLLNKIANNEVDIKKIKYDNQIFEYREDMLDYYCYDYDLNLMGYQKCLNDKVKIIEEDNKIKPYTHLSNIWTEQQQEELIDNFDRINTILNKLIDEIDNKL